MSYNDNTNFLSFEGKIGRKNYIINLLILISLFIGIFLIKFDNYIEFFRYKFLYTILIFTVDILKFAIIISILSVIYRRIADFSEVKNKMKSIFFIFYLFPVMYIYWGHYLLDFIPPLIYLLDLITYMIILPITLILTVIFSFLRSKV